MNVALGSIVQNPSSILTGTKVLAEPIQTNGLSLCGILIPDAITSTTLTFEAATSAAGPFYPIYNAAGEVSYEVIGNQYLAIDPQDFYGVQFLQIQSNANELATRSLICAMKGL